MPKLTFEEMIEPGRTIKIFYNKGNINNRTIHIRAIVDKGIVVYAYWCKHSYWWYDIYAKEVLKMLFDDGKLQGKGFKHTLL